MLSISQAAQQTGLSVKSIRHYEAIGLLCAPERGENGYRYYPQSLLKKLHFIKSAKEAGFNLKECKTLLQLCENEQRSSRDVKNIALQKIAELQARIEQQQRLLEKLKAITSQCHGDEQPDCPIIDAFTNQ